MILIMIINTTLYYEVKVKILTVTDSVSASRQSYSYYAIWTSGLQLIGQTLLVKREPTNHKDKNAVVTYEEDSYIPFTLPLDFWQEMSTRPLLRLQEKM